MRQANTLKPVRSKDEARENTVRSQSEAREILFMDRPDVRELFDTIEALPEEKQRPVIQTLTKAFTGEISRTEAEATLSSIIRG